VIGYLRSGLAALPIVLLSLAPLSGAFSLQAKDLPSDLCALLPAAHLDKALQETYDPPAKSTAPAAFPGDASGTQCDYRNDSNWTGKGLPRKVVFIVYVDGSPAVARDNFTKLSKFFGNSTPVTGVGDAAYRDSNYALHVLMGKARYYINIIPIGTYTPEKEKQLKDLAAWVAGQL
jgi:hypothetical protein